MVGKIITTIIAIATTLSFFFTSNPTKIPTTTRSSYPTTLKQRIDLPPPLHPHPPPPPRRISRQCGGRFLCLINSLLQQHQIAPCGIRRPAHLPRLPLPNPNPPIPTTPHHLHPPPGRDPYADVADQVEPTFHAYAKSANVTGPVAYVNYGRVEDYHTLQETGINVSGAVVLARYGEIYRGDIVENAYEAGAIGVLIYTDRKDYGGGGAGWFPDERWMPPSGVQVGSVFNGAGDPTTPGWPSVIEGCERLSAEEVEEGGDVPLIPSLPISGADGEEIVKSIGGVVADDDWQGDKDAPLYRIGPGPGIVELSYKAKEVIKTIQNVIGIIEGAEEPDRFVILVITEMLGHSELLIQTVALQPYSRKAREATETRLETEKKYHLLQLGCRGIRAGSTEWVEENREMLASKVVAYLNVDIAVAGPGFQASATPQLDELIIEATKQVQDPDNSSQTVYESWVQTTNYPEIGRLGGGGSDYAAFVQHIGVPSTDISFANGYPVYHSMYDDFVWMTNFGDPMFRRHVAAASIWGLVALRLADEVILSFNYDSYVDELQKSAEDLDTELLDKSISLVPLFKSIEKMKTAAKQINGEIKVSLHVNLFFMQACIPKNKEGIFDFQKINENKGWEFMWKKQPWKVREINDRLMMAERALTDREGLPGRPWYKHLIYAPSKHNDYGSKSFPGIDDAVEIAKSLSTEVSWRSVQHEIWRVSRAITQASLVLRGELT
ncbi:hypothetical protein OSB04_015160 [Centaurea solstitialis]|uniref:Uncharacterized protein n=1 Tax=Centaurea solstitialis TaxID=347529 RepID=A0AA38SYG6_9ASTR|nr:hypothetical protein OSB04_015160 [Centaurea solstitialis]